MPSTQRQTLLIVVGIVVLAILVGVIVWALVLGESPEATLEGINTLLTPGERGAVTLAPTSASTLTPGDTVEEIESDLDRQGLEDLDQSLGGIEADLQQLQ